VHILGNLFVDGDIFKKCDPLEISYDDVCATYPEPIVPEGFCKITCQCKDCE